MPRGDGEKEGRRRRRPPTNLGQYTPKKLQRRLNDSLWSTEVGGKRELKGNTEYTSNSFTWHRPGSQNPRK